MGCQKVCTDRRVLWQIPHEKHLILFSLRLKVSKAEHLCLSFCCLVLLSYSLQPVSESLCDLSLEFFLSATLSLLLTLNFYLYFVHLPSIIL